MQRKKHRAAGFLAALAAAALSGPAASAAPGAPHTETAQTETAHAEKAYTEKAYTERATVAPDGTEGDAGSGGQSISADGRQVAFVSGADNLVAGDTNGLEDAFVRDLRTGITRLASAGEDGNPWHGHVLDLSLSANGRYLAFTSNATYDTADSHIWIKDLRTGTLQRVDDAVDPDAGYVSAGAPALSADGRYVAFLALHSSSEGPAGDRSSRVYRLDRVTGERVRISQVPGESARKSAATSPSISADGNRVGYGFFVPYPSSGDWSDAYVRDVPSGELFQVDKAPDGKVSDGQTEFPQVSSDGRYAVFNSLDSQLTPGDTNGSHNVFVRDLRTGSVSRIDGADPAAYTAYPRLSADSRHLAFGSAVPASDDARQVYVRDLRTGRTVLVSLAARGGPSAAYAEFPVIDGHGRTVAFSSWADDLVPEDAGQTDSTTHVYVRHLK